MPTFSAEMLRTTTCALLEAAGTPPDIALVVGSSLVEANLMGHDSYGVLRLDSYIRMAKNGQVQPAARAVVTERHQATARIDAARGWGQPAARLAATTVIELALEYGIGAVTISNCNHVGRLGEYVE